VLTAALLMPFMIVLARRLGGRRNAQALPPDIAPRLARLEQAVDSVAIEVERISEGQRFVTKVMAQQLPAADLSQKS
jgi:hypothetical protein